MKSLRQQPTVLKEELMQRPGLDTLACVNPECQRFRLTGQDNLMVRKVYGQDHIRLLRCRTCGEEFSERRGTALFNTKVAEERAASIVNHLGEGCGVRATARLVHVAKDTVVYLQPAGNSIRSENHVKYGTFKNRAKVVDSLPS
jgi:transposase-like protein